MPSAIVLLNPRSRSGARAPVDRLLAAFRTASWSAELWAGDTPEWAQSAALRARDLGVDAIFGAGGDGLLAQILPAIMHTSTALGVVPLGTGNVWARELGLPMQPEHAISRQLASPPHRVDVGIANGRPFLVLASAGIDARIVEMVEGDVGSKALGQLAYPLATFALAPGIRGTQAQIWLDDEPPLTMPLLAGIATNCRLYGGVVPLVPKARFDDGLLDVVLFAGGGPVEATTHAVRVLAGLHHADRSVIIRPARWLRIETLGSSVPIQRDGDPLGTTPLEVQVSPSALLAMGAGPPTTGATATKNPFD
jgi:YegS/Rv2252/BmrU family lipid kinase